MLKKMPKKTNISYIYLSLIIMLFLIGCCITAYADNSYAELGSWDNFYRNENMIFNEALDFDLDTMGYPRNLGEGHKSALVYDMDRDNISEIIVLDTTSIKVFHNKELVLNSTYLIPNTTMTYDWISNMIIFDIDGDLDSELIFADFSQAYERLFILNYSSADGLVMQKSYSMSGLSNHINGQVLLKCGDTETCLMAYKDYYTNAVNNDIRVVPFNSTDGFGDEKYLSETSNIQVECFPKIPHMTYKDIDGDGRFEYIFTTFRMSQTGAEELALFIVQVNDTNHTGAPESELYKLISVGDVVNTGDCLTKEADLGKYVTSPLVTTYAGLQYAIVGYSVSDDEFQLDAYYSTGVQIPEAPFPEVFDADGQIISNIVLADVFDDTGTTDFCVLGFDNASSELDLLCASPHTGGIQSREFILDMPLDVTSEYGIYDTLIHTVQANAGGIDEILSSVGVLELNWDDNCRPYEPLTKCLDWIWQMPIENASVISVDIQNTSLEDIIAVTGSNVWYLDDGFSFSGAVIENITVDPCVEGAWKVSNASGDNVTREARVRTTVTDPDDDDVMARVTLYADSVDNQSTGWHDLSGSGAVFVDDFVINVTTTTCILRIEANDTSNPSDIDTVEYNIVVANTGVEKGDCTTSYGVEDIYDPDEIAEQEFQANNSIVNTIGDLKEVTHLNLSNTAIWLIIMLFTAIFFWKYSDHTNMTATAGILAMILSVEYILGIFLGFVDVIYFIIAIILAVGVIGFKMIRGVAVGGG